MPGVGSQGDAMMARKLAKQQSVTTLNRQDSAASAGVLQSVASLTGGLPRSGATEGGSRHAAQFIPNPQPTSAEQADLAEAAAVARKKHMKKQNMDACQQRQAMYDAWPDDPHYLQQQLSLIRQELMEKEEQLQRAHTDVRLLTSELETQRQTFDSEMFKVKAENLSQLIHTFQTEGLRGVEGLAKMQHSGTFQEGKDKERQRVYELERGMVHDLGAMRQEYTGKLGDMQGEYRARLGWLAHQQSCLESQQQKQHEQHQQHVIQQQQQQVQYAMTPRSSFRAGSRLSHAPSAATSTPYGKTFDSSQSSRGALHATPQVSRLSEIR